jgi:hypothetical protein
MAFEEWTSLENPNELTSMTLSTLSRKKQQKKSQNVPALEHSSSK